MIWLMRADDDAHYTQMGSPSSTSCSDPCCISGAVERSRSYTRLPSARESERAVWPKTHTHTHTASDTRSLLPMKHKHMC